MDVRIRKEEERETLLPEGRLDTVSAPELERMILELPEEIRLLVLDMAGIQYVSSAGLRVLLTAQKKMIARGGRLIVRNVSADVMNVLKMTGFEAILTLENRENEPKNEPENETENE